MDPFQDIAISLVFSIIRAAMKNPKKKAALKETMLKLRDKITEVWGE